METWYRVSGLMCGGAEIEEVEVEKTTHKTITLKGGYRQNKHSNYDDYYPDMESAKRLIIEECKDEIARNKKSIASNEKTLKKWSK